MTNKEAMERLSQTSGAYINKLIWIAGSWENVSEIEDFLEEVEPSFYKDYMPEIVNSDYFHEYQENPIEGLINFEYYGFLAEVHLPKVKDFRFENGSPVSWSSSPGYCELEHIYAESIPKLISIIEKLAGKRFEMAWARELLAKTNNNEQEK